ncbi:AfsR/SARP family transcriptional regulator [Nonomuraea mesophila]|uniref:AfsR/SARP family transcriptional regulator n=1 Tax=Nonomuraea mesophila TaxID=2530382 RepID=UPI0014094810|nr:BTAD domain-containing putative transcriptional regulator [Nonomuraea mesophila]
MTKVTFEVLGPVVVRHPDGRQAELTRKARAVLAALLLHANTPVTRQRLIEALWDDPPASAVSNVQTYISQIRRALPPAARLHTLDSGYLLEVAREDVDLLVFEDQVRLAAAEADPERAARRLDRALRLWRGTPAENTPLTGTMTARFAELEERLAGARFDWADRLLQLGMETEAVGGLRRFTREHPLRERGWLQLMLALSRLGRRGEALETYQRARTVLNDELGIEPGPELRQLQAAVLAGGTPEPAPPAPAQPVALCQLPPDIADFVGRTEEVATLLVALRAPDAPPAVARLRGPVPTAPAITVITGPPGIGKSTLAVRVAHLVRPDFPDGQLYLRMSSGSSGPREPYSLLAELLRGLQPDASDLPATLEGRAALFRSLVADRALLIVLDNAAGADQVSHLLPGTPHSAVLVTSRGPLTTLPGVTTVPLGVPTEDEARALLEGIAGETRVRGEPEAARKILHACGYLPLAIRIAGARLATRPGWPMRTFAARLADNAARLDELAIGGQDVRAGFAMSYDALPDVARRAFRLLGLAGLDSTADWSLAALMGVRQREAEAAAETLALAGLLSAEEVDLCGQPRYRMHDLLQDFAHERAEAEESPAGRRAALARLVEECLRRVRGGMRDYPPPARPPLQEYSSDHRDSSRTWLLAERGTLEAAVALAEPAQAVELAQRLSPFLAAHGFRQEVSDLLEGVAQRAPDTRSAMLTRLVLADIELEYHRCRSPAADPADLLAYFEQSGDGHACAYALLALATRDLMEGWPGEALARAERAIARFEALKDTYGLLNALSTAGGAYLDLGRHEAVATVCRRGLGLATESRYGDHAVRFRRMLGIASFNSGEVEVAIEHYKQSIRSSRALGWGPGERIALRRLGEAYSALGRYELARTAFDRCALLFFQAGDAHGQALTFYALGELSRERGRAEEARRYFHRCLDLVQEPLWRSRATARLAGLSSADVGAAPGAGISAARPSGGGHGA